MSKVATVPYETHLALKKEYDQFCYIISHDLSAPLRHIDQFSSLLLRNLNEHMGEEEKVFSGFIKQAVIRNQAMVDSLLTLSRITTDRESFGHHDVSTLIDGIVGEHPETKIDNKLEEKFSIYCDHHLIVKMFKLLVDNAIKFKDDSRPLEICLTGDLLSQDQCIIKFSDNGIGLASDKENVIFDPFRKLHSDDENSGLGMGLTYCRKIVHLHNGTIACTGMESKGAQFSIILPLNEGSLDST